MSLVELETNKMYGDIICKFVSIQYVARENKE